MTADRFIQYLSWAVFSVLFVTALSHALRDPRPVTFDIALFFSIPALIILANGLTSAGLLAPNQLLSAIVIGLFLSLGYVLLRLANDLAVVARWVRLAAAPGLALLVVGAFVFAPQLPLWLTLLMLLYLVVSLFYSAFAFGREAVVARGVTRRRLQAAAAGSLLLMLLFLLVSLNLFAPTLSNVWQISADLAGLAAGIMYLVGFAPPRWLRRAWQEPELRAFLTRAANLPRLTDLNAMLREIEHGASTSLGARVARIGLWNEAEQALIFPLGDPDYRLSLNEPVPSARAFREQRALFTDNVPRALPDYAELSRQYGLLAIMAAPITAVNRRFGVLIVYAPHALVFADDDLALIQLLADQAAVLLEIRSLIDELARAQAQAEATRLKEDFLSAAAHDLKTPLTTLIARAQLLERTAQRHPSAPADIVSLQQIVQEGQRLRRLVLELLDAARVEQGRLVGALSDVDLAELAREVCGRLRNERHPCSITGDEHVIGQYDRVRMVQLLENLLENAITYSPRGGTVEVQVRRAGDRALLSIADHGIGITPDDLPHIFERFYRGTRVDDRRFAGMGLGLFICRGIVEQHGGRIWATSQPDQGSTFLIELPLVLEMEAVHA